MTLKGQVQVMLVLASLSSSGCRERGNAGFVSSEKVQLLSAEAQASLRTELNRRVGTFDEPKILTADESSSAPRKLREQLLLGQEVYQLRCVQCHGVSGDGNGPAAFAMYPRPRDYRRGLFKFTSTPYGAKPMRADLIRTVKTGVRGTSMPEFKLLPEEEIEAVVEYVLYLSQRGEVEDQMAGLADAEGTLTKELVDEEEIVPSVLEGWSRANGLQVSPATPEPVFTVDHVTRGKAAFLSRGCSKCHGENGRGQTPDNLAGTMKDSWGHVTRAADLTSGMLHGGSRPIDVYRRIYSGINGTPMPGFASALEKEPDTIWDLVSYVLYVSGRRRAGDHLPFGSIAPYVPGGSKPAEN